MAQDIEEQIIAASRDYELLAVVARTEAEAQKASVMGATYILCLEEASGWTWSHTFQLLSKELLNRSKNLDIFDFPARVVDDFLSRSELSFCLVDEDGVIRYFNKRMKEQMGYRGRELLGQNLAILFSDDLKGIAMETFHSEMRSGDGHPSKWSVVSKEGKEQTMLSFPHIFEDLGGRKFNLAVFLDLEKLFEDYMHRDTSAEILREIASTSPVIMTIYDLERKINVYQSRSMFEMLGYTDEFIEEAKNEPESFRRKLFHEDYIREIDQYYAEVQDLKAFEKKQLIYRVRDHEGKWRWIRKITSVFKKEEERVTQVLNTFEDITAQKESESRIFITESRNKALISAVPDFIFRIDSKGYYLDYKGAEEKENAVVKDGRVLMPETLIGRQIGDVLDADTAVAFMTSIAKAIETGLVQTISYKLNTAQGEREFETLINRSGPNEVICVARDVTERRRQEDLLRDRLQFIEFTSRLSNDVLLTDLDQVDEIIYSALDFVCRYTSTNRAFIFTSRNDREAFQLQHSWVDDHTADYVERDQVVDQSDFQPLASILREKGRFVRNFTEEGFKDLPLRIRNIIETQTIHATALTPLIVEERLYGFLGFDLVDTDRIWTEAELEYFDITAKLLSNTIYRKFAVEELIESRERALRASRAKEDFLATMSHEIRTPLNAIIGMNGLLMNSGLNEEQLELLDVSKLSADHLLQLINDILDFTKIESGRLELDKIEFSLHELMHSVEKAYQGEASGKGLFLKTSIDPQINGLVVGDEVRIHQILSNLVSNAIKFTEHGGVEIQLNLMSGDVKALALEFRVNDSGIGIAEDMQSQIFERFIQEDSSTSRKFGGTGLGLSIVRRLVNLMDGSIQLESRKGEGASFSFKLVLPSVTRRAGELAAPWSTTQIFPGRKILVVEDNLLNQKVAVGFLVRHELDVDVANNGFEALDRVRSTDYDIILMDLQMPEMDGIQASREIRQLKGEHFPIVALTANANPQMKEDVKSVGIHEYITKPFRAVDLQRVLHKYLG